MKALKQLFVIVCYCGSQLLVWCYQCLYCHCETEPIHINENIGFSKQIWVHPLPGHFFSIL